MNFPRQRVEIMDLVQLANKTLMTILEFIKQYPIFNVGDFVVIDNEYLRRVKRLPFFGKTWDTKKEIDTVDELCNKNLQEDHSYSPLGYEFEKYSPLLRQFNTERTAFFNLETMELYDEEKHPHLIVERKRFELIDELERLKEHEKNSLEL